MKARWLFALIAASLSLPGWAVQSQAADISMAIHEGGFSVFEEARRITVAKGDSTLALDGPLDGVQPNKLVANFAAWPGVRLRGQRFLNSKYALLEDFVGKTILVVTIVAETRQQIVREAKLLRARPGLLIELDGRIELPRRQNLRAGAEEKVALFNAARLPVQKTYRLISDSNAHIRYLRGPTAKRNPDVRLKFKNEAANGLGMQLPKGVMQAYGQGRYLGEDRIRHTPKGEDVSIAIGRAVDVTAKRRRTDYCIQGLPKGTAEVAYQITLRNAKSQDVTVDVVERMIGEFQILSQSLPHIKDTDRQAVWPVSVPAGGEVSLRYKARVRFR